IVVRLREYFTAGAAGVVDEVLGIVAEFVGRTVPEILQALDDPDLLRRVTELARRAGYAPRTDAAGGEAGGGWRRAARPGCGGRVGVRRAFGAGAGRVTGKGMCADRLPLI